MLLRPAGKTIFGAAAREYIVGPMKGALALFSLEGRTVVVTGAASGLGRAIAGGFVEAGGLGGLSRLPRAGPRGGGDGARGRPDARGRGRRDERGPGRGDDGSGHGLGEDRRSRQQRRDR